MQNTVSVDLSIIIVNYNAGGCLIDCLRSIYNTANGLTFEVILVDNASSDNSIKGARKHFPGVRVIENDFNYGFARACNQGIEAGKGEFVLLMNPDVIVKDEAIARMMEKLKSRPDIGIVGPKILNGDGTVQLACARPFLRYYDLYCDTMMLGKVFPGTWLFDRIMMGYWDHRDSREVECLSGACMMMRTEELVRMGMLDEDYFLYGEDIELCYRYGAAGKNRYYLSEAEVVHLVGRSRLEVEKTEDAFSLILTYCGYEQFFKNRHGPLGAIPLRLIIIFGSLLRIAAALIASCRQKNRSANFRQIARKYARLLLWALGIVKKGRIIRAVRG